MSSVAYTLQHQLGRFNEELFPEDGGCKHWRKKNQVHKICKWNGFASRRWKDAEEHADGAKWKMWALWNEICGTTAPKNQDRLNWLLSDGSWGGLVISKALIPNLNFNFLNRILLLLISSSYPIVFTRLRGPVPDPILPEKFLGYSREWNQRPLGQQSDVLTTIPNRWSEVLLHAINLRHWTHGFTSLPKDVITQHFYALKKIHWTSG